jgi:hypothetical protein
MSQAPKWHVCPVCGGAYRWIGWMSRKVFVPGKGYHATDTHIMACAGVSDPLAAPRTTAARPGPGTPRITSREVR